MTLGRPKGGPRAAWADRDAIDLDSTPVPDEHLEQRMVKHVCERAQDAVDARDLLTVLGLMGAAQRMKEERDG